jgi:hypothetical protein
LLENIRDAKFSRSSSNDVTIPTVGIENSGFEAMTRSTSQTYLSFKSNSGNVILKLLLFVLFPQSLHAQTAGAIDNRNKDYKAPVWIDNHTVARQIVRIGKSGRDIKLGNHIHFNANCEILAMPAVYISKAAKHGFVCTRIENSPMISLNFGKHPYDCAHHIAPHIRVYYRSFPDFVGTDSFQYYVDYEGGRRLIEDVDLTIEQELQALRSQSQTPNESVQPIGPVPACPDLQS